MKVSPKLSMVVLLLLIVSLLSIMACSNTKTTGTQTANSPATSAQSGSSASKTGSGSQTTPGAASDATQTLNIGVVCWLGWPPGLDMLNGIKVMVEMDNAKGGIDIGGQKYKINLIYYDTNNSQATEVSAVNKLVFEDKVKFIIADGMFDAAWLATTDANKVLAATMGGDYTKNLTPNWKYDFYPSFYNDIGATITGWVCVNHPEMVKNYVVAVPDNQIGHMIPVIQTPTWQLFGVTPTFIYYPVNSQDLSSLGTKIKSMNPSALGVGGGGTMGDGMALKAAYEAGYKGQIFLGGTGTVANLLTIVPKEGVEGMIAGAWPVEFDPPLTQMAKEFKEGWIAKYGKWEGPEVQGIGQYAAMKAAMQQAGTTDVDKVAAVVFNGMKYESPTGPGMMISRPDLGNERTVDSVCTTYIKQVKEGKLTVLDTIKMEDALTLVRKAFPAKQ
jgi:branched-chain amino acid transport system substrate-binding protein